MIPDPLSDLTVGVFVVAVLAAAAALLWLLKRMREQRPSSKHDVAVAPSTQPELVAQEAASPAQPTELQISPPPLQMASVKWASRGAPLP
ncbi:hypothetical protein IscW_ISCW007505 [Ixodes scapularis]|uniref:Uncharacterized protein n=1 Tax=Ixodes scapularis TaxID=6945 RepID=B7PRE9_IXOSC|nr:hypothetical protein IscW_ISCW007505 [Ixodes scapularis]|eukprot:XP_002399537.1 hypothetical protein IscW_ISCW007505 [Ixodes scapularis]